MMIKLGVILLLGLILVSVGCMNFKKSDRAINRDLKKIPIQYSIESANYSGRSMRYLSIKNKNHLAPVLVFIHGAPGSLTSFYSYIKDSSLTDKYNIVVVDRFGYGESDYGKYTDINTQVDHLARFLKDLKKGRPLFLIGHSYGGPVAFYTAAKSGNLVNGTIMVAPAIDPNNEKYFWFGKLGYWKATRWLTSKALRVSASEKYNHVNDLLEMEQYLNKLESPVLHIHGTVDKIVPVVNTKYTSENVDKKWLEISIWKESGHLIPFKEQPRLVEAITNFIERNL